jgi:alanine racemase
LLAQRQMQPLLSLAKAISATLLLRPGIALYGYALPFSGDPTATMPIELEPVLSWKTAIASIRTVQAGTRVGYDGTFIAPGEMQLALLPVGYADGLNRKLSNRGHVLIRGIAAPIVGRVSMDLTIVDITHIPGATVRDEVVILGEQNGQRITADDQARWAETISYEILCNISARVPRVAGI